MDPMQSPVARLRNSPALTAQFGYNPAEVDAKFQYGMAQQQFAAEKPFGMDALAERYGSYGNNIPSMRKNLMNLPTSRAQY